MSQLFNSDLNSSTQPISLLYHSCMPNCIWWRNPSLQHPPLATYILPMTCGIMNSDVFFSPNAHWTELDDGRKKHFFEFGITKYQILRNPQIPSQWEHTPPHIHPHHPILYATVDKNTHVVTIARTHSTWKWHIFATLIFVLTPFDKFMDVISPLMDFIGWYGYSMWRVLAP